MKKTTEELLTDLKECDDIANYIKENRNDMQQHYFLDYFEDMLKKYQKTMGDLEKEVELGRSTLYAIKKGERNGTQDAILKIGFAIGLELDEMQRFLKLSHNHELYVRNKRDSVIIYGIHHHMNIYEVDEMLIEYKEKPLLKESAPT